LRTQILDRHIDNRPFPRKEVNVWYARDQIRAQIKCSFARE